MFTAIAPRYDFLNHLLSLNVDRSWRRAAVARLGWEAKPDGTYLDLCAGTLDLAAELARRDGFRGRIVGADFVVPMLERGRHKAPRTSPVAADALALPFPTAHFDGVLVWDVLEYMAPPLLNAVIERLLRIVRPKCYLLAFFHSDEKLSTVPYYSFRIEEFNKLQLSQHGARTPAQLFNNRSLEKLFQRFESKLEQYHGQLNRAAVELAKDWRTDKMMRNLEALLIVADEQATLVVSGNGDVIEPDDGIIAIGSGGSYALAAGRALKKHGDALSARDLAVSALEVASDICVYTNNEIIVEEIKS